MIANEIDLQQMDREETNKGDRKQSILDRGPRPLGVAPVVKERADAMRHAKEIADPLLVAENSNK